MLRLTEQSAGKDQQWEKSTNPGQPMPSNGLEFHSELDKQGHRNLPSGSPRRKANLGCPALYQRMIFVFDQYCF